jgi:hypothetical protein
LLVKNDGTPVLGDTFVLSEFEDRFVSQLAQSDLMNQPGSEHGVMGLDKGLRLRRLSTPNQLQEGRILVIAQLPLDREKEKGTSDICIFTVLRAIQFSGLRASLYR